MKVMVTGGSGFVGHHIVESLLKETDHDIVCVDRLSYSGTQNRLHEILDEYPEESKRRVQIVYHDLKAEFNDFIKKQLGDVNYILHVAAQSHVDKSIVDPLSFAMDNVVGTVNCLNYARTLENLKMFLYFSTDEVFGPAPNEVKYKEFDRYNSTNPYSASKAGGEEFVVAFQNTYKLPCVISHTMNIFGERQDSEKFIPLCINKILAGETVTIHSSPDKKTAGSRHYIDVKDVARGVLFLMDRPELKAADDIIKCPKYNISGSTELSNLELAQIIAKVLDKPLKYNMMDFHSARPGHDLRYALDNTLLRDIGWEPELIEESLRRCVEWTVNNERWL